MSKRLSKEDVRGPDAFISTTDRVIKQLEAYKKPILALLLLALFGGASSVGYNYYVEYQEQQARAAIYPAEAAIAEKLQQAEDEVRKNILGDRKMEDLSEEEQESINAQLTEIFDQPIEERIKFETTLGDDAEQMHAQIQAYWGTKQATVAAMTLANIYSEFNRHEQAEKLLIEARNHTSSETLKHLLNAQLAGTYVGLKKYSEAISKYEEILNSENATFLHANVVLNLAMALETSGQLDQARQMYQRATTEFADTEAGRAALGYLRLLKLNQTKEMEAAKKDNKG